MPTLDFKGKQFVCAHHLTVSFTQLNVDAKKSIPKDGQASRHALKALLLPAPLTSPDPMLGPADLAGPRFLYQV